MACPKCGCDTRESWWCLPCLRAKVGFGGPVPVAQPPYEPPLFHMLKDMTHKDGKAIVSTTCGLVGSPPGMKKNSGIATTVWTGDVTCPACKMFPGVRGPKASTAAPVGG